LSGIERSDCDECWCCGGLHDSRGLLCPDCDDWGCPYFGGECESDHKPVFPDGGNTANGIDRAIQRIASEKTEVENRHPQKKEPGSTDDAYLHGKWRGLEAAIEILEEERSRETGTDRSGGNDE